MNSTMVLVEEVYSWKRPCKDHVGGAVCGPFNDRSADVLLYGVDKPKQPITASFAETNVTHEGYFSVIPSHEDSTLGLSVEMLNLVFQKQVFLANKHFLEKLTRKVVGKHPEDICYSDSHHG